MKELKELNKEELQEIEGGALLTYIVYVAIGGAIYKIVTSKSGRLSIPKLITFEWRG